MVIIEFKYFGSSIFIRPMFYQTWLAVKSKLFRLICLANHSYYLELSWLPSPNFLNLACLSDPCYLGFDRLSSLSFLSLTYLIDSRYLKLNWLYIKSKLLESDILARPRLSSTCHVCLIHFILPKYFNSSSTENVRYLICSATLYILLSPSCKSLLNGS